VLASEGFPSTVDANPWIADQELPQIPAKPAAPLLEVSRPSVLAERVKEDRVELLVREGWVLGMGEAVREAKGELLAELASSSSSMDIRRRVRGRNEDAGGAAVLVLEEEGDPLSAGMAMDSRAV
jgi:hypothetical protein